MECYN